MRQLSAALDWVVDDAVPFALAAALVVGWLVAVVLMFLLAWWLGVIGVVLGAPFAFVCWNQARQRFGV